VQAADTHSQDAQSLRATEVLFDNKTSVGVILKEDIQGYEYMNGPIGLLSWRVIFFLIALILFFVTRRVIDRYPRLRLLRDTYWSVMKNRFEKGGKIALRYIREKFSRDQPSRPLKSTISEYVKASPTRSNSDKMFVELKSMSAAGEYVTKKKGQPPGFNSIISDSCVRKLKQHLPERFTCKDWKLLYSSDPHGYNLLTAFERASNAGPFILVVMDMNRFVFGAFCNEDFRNTGKVFYGTGESFIFRLLPDFRVHKWSGKNEQICVSTNEMIAFGGGGKFALWLDASFNQGSSEEGSSTFESYKCLASQEMFKCCKVELWGFTAPSTSSPKRSVYYNPRN